MEAWDFSDYSSSDDELDFIARKEDYSFLKYHKIKKSSSMVKPRTPTLKARKKRFHLAPKKAFKDVDIKH